MIGVSDNGGPVQGGQGANNYPLRSGKFSSFEGVGTHHPSQHIPQVRLRPVSDFCGAIYWFARVLATGHASQCIFGRRRDSSLTAGLPVSALSTALHKLRPYVVDPAVIVAHQVDRLRRRLRS
eukprot:COSAG02_NODE_247_length_27137_cov_61.275057_21_plen_123_part_00